MEEINWEEQENKLRNNIKEGKFDYKVRPINEEEFEALKRYFQKIPIGDTHPVELIGNYFFGVIEHYISDCPAYAGKIIFAIFGLPEFYELYTFDRNTDEIVKIEQDIGFKSQIIVSDEKKEDNNKD